MKILLISPKPPYPPLDGGSYAMKEFLEMLLDEGQTVRLICIHTHKHDFLSTSFPSHPLLRIIPVFLDTKVKAIPFLFHLLLGSSPNLQRFRSKKLREEIYRVLSDEEPDMVVMESPYSSMEVSTNKSSIPVVLRSHNIESNIWKNLARNAGFLKSKLYILLATQIQKKEEKLWSDVDGVLSISQDDSIVIKKFNSNVIDLLPSVSVLPDEKSEGTRISFLGSMDWEPNIEAVVEIKDKIWPLVNRKSPELEFHLAGKRDGEIDYSDPDIRFIDHGMVKSAEEFLKSSQILLVPLKSGSGLKIKTLESMAYGLCVIGSPLAFEGIEGEDEEHFIIAHSPEEFQARLFELLENPERRERISRAASELVRTKYSRLQAADRFKDMLNSLNL